MANFYLIMSNKTSVFRAFSLLSLLWAVGVCPVFGENWKTLPGHVPAITRKLAVQGNWPATNEIRLAIGLALRDAPGLQKFLDEVYDPTSPNFRRYLTPEEFTARFGPTEADYAAVKQFASDNGLRITSEHGNRLLLDVAGPAAAVERAFRLKLRRFQHPTEAREFFAPDTEPTVAANLTVTDVSGLSDFQKPFPKLVKPKTAAAPAVPKSGSAAGGDFMGNDFRAAYLPGTTLTGAGQIVGLLQFDGFYASDITAYRTAAGISSIPVETILIGNYSGRPTANGNGEVALDIEMAMAMAPGLAKIIVFTGGPNGLPEDVLNRMAASNTVKNLSCSWGWSGGPSTTTDAIFKQMAAQGQSFFNASGDSDAFTTGVNSANAVDGASLANMPSSSPYITQVGGTTLTTAGPGGAWSSETVWNWGGGNGSSGGISSYYAIPSWQTNIDFTASQGSSAQRNIPDVSLTAENIFYTHDNGQSGSVAGTSCSAPLWAGFMALVNERAAALNRPAVGLINQAVYAFGTSSNYAQGFHDITSGDNTWNSSPNLFYAVSGYDLCTGWGTPASTQLIDALVGQGGSGEPLGILSDNSFVASGAKGGPFNPAPAVITLTNNSEAALNWSLLNSNVVTWLKISPVGGTLAAGDTTNVILNYNSTTTNLAVGNFTASLKFTNRTSHVGQTIAFQLQVLPILSVTPTNGFTANGAVGGPFDVAMMDFTILNRGATSAVWKVSKPATWLAVLASTGAVAGNYGQATITVAMTTNANKLAAGIYKTSLTVTDSKNQKIQTIPFTLRVGQNVVANGGFETGNFTSWTLAAANTTVSSTRNLFHTGQRGAALGQTGSLGSLSQVLPTVAGQNYLLSFWLNNPVNTHGATPNELIVKWEGTTIFDRVNIPTTNWFNLQFTVAAANSGSLLEFNFQDDPYYLALDDVSLKPVAAPKLLAVASHAVMPNRGTFNFTFAVTAGFQYQVQYKTDLAQPAWLDLGAPIMATNTVLNAVDTDTSNFPQKFYRLLQVP